MKDQFEKFSPDAKRALISAQREASRIGSHYIGTEHILVGILSQKQSLGAEILRSFGVTLEKIYLVLDIAPRSLGELKTETGLSNNAKKTIEQATDLARKYGHFYIGTEHLILGLLSDKESSSYKLIQSLRVSPEKIRDQLGDLFKQSKPNSDELQEKEPVASRPRRSKTPALDYFSTDLTEMAKLGKLDPVIGREKEIERLAQVLNRRKKNNPVLIGEAGVGKTAIIEGLASKIVAGEVPDKLQEKRILSVDLAGMIAGTKFRGEFEERIKKVIEEAKKNPNIILFIDELHTVVGAGAAEGSMDAGNILKPALSRGELQCIGATTLEEYRKYIEKDAALERRFQPIKVSETTIEETVKILKGIRSNYEKFHSVSITDEAIEVAAKLAKRYIADRFLPDKAIDLIDEAASKVGIKKNVLPAKAKKLQEEYKKIISEKEKAVEEQNYEKAAQFRDKEITIYDEIGREKQKKMPEGSRPKITSEDIAEIVSGWTGVPVTKLVEVESKVLLDLDKLLRSRIVGQDEAVEAIAKSIRRSRVGISNPARPIGSFIFLGPTGVGKTELAKVLAELVFESNQALVKIDMSEFMERHNVSRLVGAPPGYVGYEESGKLTEAVRQKPYSVILLDEIEKAHPEIFNMLLQILEDGYLTDAKGKKVDFRNTIIIMTSNIGLAELNRQAEIGFEAQNKSETLKVQKDYEKMKENVLGKLKDNFRPEFLNRLDKIIVFKPLSKEAIRKIVDLQIVDLQARLVDKKLTLKFESGAKNLLANLGFDPENGARPLRRVIQNMIEDQLAEEMLKGKIKEGDTVKIKKAGEEFLIEPAKKLVEVG